MATFSLQRNTKAPKAVVKKNVVRNHVVDRKRNIATDNTKEKVVLTKHEGINFSPEYFSYMNESGQEVKFNGIIIKNDDGSYVGKQIIPHKVILEYHPEVKSVNYSPEHFTYINQYGKEKEYIGDVEFDLYSNSYTGVVVEDVLKDDVVEIFKEK